MAAGRSFTREAQKHLRVQFADNKTAIVSSHRKLALSVAHHLGMQEESVKTQTVGLGVGVSAGKARAATTTRRKKKMQKALKRKARLRALTDEQVMRPKKNLLVWPPSSGHVWG